MSEELRKLEELWQMGFISEADYTTRKALIQQQTPPTSSDNNNNNTSSETKAINLDLTDEFEAQAELLHAFNDKQSRLPNTYVVSCHQNTSLEDTIHTEYLHCPKNNLLWLLQQKGVTEEDALVIADICNSYPDSLHFAFSSLDLPAFENSLFAFVPYKLGDKVSADLVVPYGTTKLDPTHTSFFQAMNIATKIYRGCIEVIWDSVILAKGGYILEVELRMCELMGINRAYKQDLVFVVKNGTYIPARYATHTIENGINEAHANSMALATSVGHPTESRVSYVICETFYNVTCFSAGLSDDRFFELNEQYVAAFTSYGTVSAKERQKKQELDEIERTQKPAIVAMEAEIAKVKEDVAVFEAEYKDLKSNFEDQDFDFTGLKLTAIPHQEILVLSPGQKRKLPVLVELKIGQAPKDLERVPFNLAIVLDRSGSMQGDKLNNCKFAINNVIDNMIPEDVLHLVMYDDMTEVVFQDGKSNDAGFMKKKVNDIWARNSTNISGGLQKAVEVFNASTCTFHKRTFLFSDGQANAGLTTPQDLSALAARMQQNSQIITSTFGIGADFNYQVMDGIAKSGHGSYFFIEDSEIIPKLVEKGLRGLTSLLATDAVLKIRVLQKGVRVSKVYGHQISTSGDCEVKIGDIRYGDLKQTLLELELENDFASAGTHPVVLFELCYVSQEQENGTTFLRGDTQTEMSLTFTTAKEQQQAINNQVEVVKVIKEAAELDERAVQAFQQGKIFEAIDCKRDKMVQLQRVSYFDRYGFTRVLLQKTRKSLLEFLLSGLQQKVREYNSAIQSVNWNYNDTEHRYNYSSAHAGSSKSSALFAKQLAYEMHDEEDDDMGYGLFD